MYARNRTWLLGSDPVERCRQRTLPVEGGDGSTLSLDFTTGVLDPRLTFTRTTNATFINSQGYVEWANSNMYWNTAFEGLSGSNPSLTSSSGWGYQLTTGGTAVFNGDGTVTVTTTTAERRAIVRSSGFSGGGLRVVASVDVTIASGSLQASQVIVTGIPTNAQHYVNGVIWNSSHPIWNGGFLPVGTQFNIAYATDSQTSATTSMYFGVGCTSNIAGSATFSNPRWTMWKGSATVPYYPNTSATNNSTADRYKSADYQAPRFDYDPTTPTPRGLLIEGSATNLCNQGQYCWSGNWGRSNDISINSILASSGPNPQSRVDGPDGGSGTGTSIYLPTASFQRLSQAVTVEESKQYTYSMWVRPGTNGATNFRLATFTPASAWMTTVGSCNDSAVTITNVSGGGTKFSNLPDRWVRVSVVFTTDVGQTSVTITAYPNIDTAVPTTNYIWGAQLELGSGASSVIPTGASTGNRAADDCLLDNISTAFGFNAAEGTILIRYGNRVDSGSMRSYTFLPASGATNQIFEATGNAFNAYSSGSFVAQIGATNASGARVCAAYKLDDYAVSVNGGTVTTDTTGAVPSSLTRLSIGGSAVNSAAYNYGPISLFKYWPTRLPDAQLQVLST
jgi:hypothetical protein